MLKETAVVKKKGQQHVSATTPTSQPRSIITYNPSRRDLLFGGIALLLAPAAKAFARSLQTRSFDVAVIGAGTAGIPTALFCARRGARVLLIEKSATLGGTLHWSTGQVAAAGTVFQARLGIEDTPELHYSDCMRINGGTSDPALTRLAVENAGRSLNWLVAHGYEVMDGHPVTGIGHDHYETRRYQQGIRSGLSILEVYLPALRKEISSGQITLALQTEAVELMQRTSGGPVTGVLLRTAEGELQDALASNTVITTGGCASNARLFEELHGVPLYANAAYPTAKGEGLLLGLAAGGWLRGGEKFTCLPGMVPREHRYPTTMYATAPLNPNLRQPWEILVNAKGQRFVREDHESVTDIEHAITAQPGQRHWAIYDQAILDAGPPLIPGWSRRKLAAEYQVHPMFQRADSIDLLGLRAGLNAVELSKAIAGYNQSIENGEPDVFGRKHRPLPIAKPPFYSVEMQGWTVLSFAGLAVNNELQVTRPDGKAIPGLYAAGEVLGAGATSGSAYTNGMMVTPAITFAQLLGEKILPL